MESAASVQKNVNFFSSSRSYIKFLLVIWIFAGIGNTQAICNVPTSGLMECKPAATPPNPPPPSAACCAVLSHADFKCLCSYKHSPLLPLLGINAELAMQLPEKCHIPHPATC